MCDGSDVNLLELFGCLFSLVHVVLDNTFLKLAVSINNLMNMKYFLLDVWQYRDELGNFEQKHDVELIKEAKR